MVDCHQLITLSLLQDAINKGVSAVSHDLQVINQVVGQGF
jgi:hypothetical protein